MKNPKIKLSRYKVTRGSKVYFVGEVLNTRTNEKHFAMFFTTDSRIEELTQIGRASCRERVCMRV